MYGVVLPSSGTKEYLARGKNGGRREGWEESEDLSRHKES